MIFANKYPSQPASQSDVSYDRVISVDDPIVEEVWRENRNYLIEYSDGNNNVCAIYFTSNGIYFPNTEKTFVHEIVERNRYEWYGTRFKEASKHIFVRDVFKQWYLRGINKDIDSHEKLFEFLRKETEGYEIVTIGSSAGGYASALFGSLLRASKSIAFCPQITIVNKIENKNPVLAAYAQLNDDDLCIYSKIKDNRNLVMFYSMYSKTDEDDVSLAKSISGVLIRFHSGIHGVPFKDFALPTIMNMDMNQLHKLSSYIHYIWPFSLRYCDLVTLINKCKRRLSKILS
jgi:hypothetical protein